MIQKRKSSFTTEGGDFLFRIPMKIGVSYIELTIIVLKLRSKFAQPIFKKINPSFRNVSGQNIRRKNTKQLSSLYKPVATRT